MLSALILDHFQSIDPTMHRLLIDLQIEPRARNNNHQEYFARICEEIIGQQLSGKVAGVIISRFRELLGTESPTAELVLQTDDQKLRDVGMAWAKVRAIKDLAQKTASGELVFAQYPSMSDEDVMNSLVSVKGIGPWTVEMLLIFTLGREDVFSIKDLALKKAACSIYKLNPKLKTCDSKILKLAEKWAPFRSYASLALWKSLDIEGWWRG